MLLVILPLTDVPLSVETEKHVSETISLGRFGNLLNSARFFFLEEGHSGEVMNFRNLEIEENDFK